MNLKHKDNGTKLYLLDKNVPKGGFRVQYLFKIQEKLVPELISQAQIRYTILRNIFNHQPLGRRILARKIGISERQARNELDFLQKRGWIESSRAGTVISAEGECFLQELDVYIKEIKGIEYLEDDLARVLALKKVIIVPGNLESVTVIKEIGRRASSFLKSILQDGDIIAVTGGKTLAMVANSMQQEYDEGDILVLPGRGGLGEDVEIQSNTIAANLARKICGKYKLLHIPDNLSDKNYDLFIQEPSIQKILNKLKKSNILLHGIGTAREMAIRRGMSKRQVHDLLNKGAVGESFGYYFNEQGEIIYSTTSVGLDLKDLHKIDKVIAVAGGVEKAEAILAAVSPEYQDILICDENTARKIINLRR